MDDRTAPDALVIRDLPEVIKNFPVSSAIFGLSRTHRAAAAAMLADIGLYLGQEIVLMHLDPTRGQSQKSLCNLLRVDHSTVAKSVSRLEKADIVRRRRAEHDERVSLVTLTPKGVELREKVLQIWARLEAVTAPGLTEAERDQFTMLAAKLAASIER